MEAMHLRHVRCAFAFDSSITTCCTCLTLAGPRLQTILSKSQIFSIGLSGFDIEVWEPGQNIKSMSLQKVQSRVCGMRRRTILHQAHTLVISKKKGCLDIHTGMQLLLSYYSHKILKEEKKTIRIEEARLRKLHNFRQFIRSRSLFIIIGIDFCNF